MKPSEEKLEPILFRYRHRELRSQDLELIRRTIQERYAEGRSQISRALCELWNWRQPNGALKQYPCRDLLLRLEEAGHIELPPRIKIKDNRSRRLEQPPKFSQEPLSGSLSHYQHLEVRPVFSKEERYLWDFLIEHFHYLRYRPVVGEHLKYLALLDQRVVACLGWGGAAWKSRHRETFIGWSDLQKRNSLHYLANNVRFLILPWVKIPHLASKVLGANARRLSRDWQAVYSHPIYLVETFIDTSRFLGTSYRAANWIYLGQTQGSAKRGSRYYRHGHAKAIYVLPLHRQFQKLLRHGTS